MALSLSSCDKDTEGLTYITDHVNIQLEGDDLLLIPVGTEFVEPGYTGTLYDKNTNSYIDVTDKIIVEIRDMDGEVVDEIDTSAMGVYTITYWAASTDGFLYDVKRTVMVCDPSVPFDMSGTYTTDMNLSMRGESSFLEYAIYYGYTTKCTGIIFNEIAPGFYEVSDLMGGWYDQLRGFNQLYPEYPGIGCMTGQVSVDKDGNINLISSYIDAWGDGLDYLENGKFDPETGTITYNLSYGGAVFLDVVLNRDNNE